MILQRNTTQHGANPHPSSTKQKGDKMDSTNKFVIETTDLGKSYKNVTALKKLNLICYSQFHFWFFRTKWRRENNDD